MTTAQKSYQIVLDNIQRQILNGEYNLGDKLPPEREMSETFNVSRNSVREALRILEVIGLIECKHGEGHFIVNKLDGYMVNGLTAMFTLNKGTALELLQMRRAIELESIRNIIERRCPEDLEKLLVIVRQYLLAGSFEEGMRLDEAFHHTIVSLSGNSIYSMVFNMLSPLIFPYMQKMASMTLEYESKDVLAKDHADVIRAIDTADIHLAYTVITRHLLLSEESRTAYTANRDLELSFLGKNVLF